MSTEIAEGTDPKHPVHIYTDGIYDCFHYGHAKVFEQCKKMFPYVYLVVGVCSDVDTSEEKGRPIMTVQERCECIKHCKWVDQIVPNAPWVCSLEFLDSIGCKYIAHDPEPYPFGDCPDLYGKFKEAKRFLGTKRTEGISTTDIIYRVLRDYDLYVQRSVRKGAKKEDINISSYKYFSAKMIVVFQKRQKRKKNNTLKYYFDMWKGKTEEAEKNKK